MGNNRPPILSTKDRLSPRSDNWHEKTRQEVKTAEKKIATGIQQIYELAKSKNPRYDTQGIAIVEIASNELNKDIKKQFPNQLGNGVTIHLFREGFTPHPELFYMLQQKIKSLRQAAMELGLVNLIDSYEISVRSE